LEYCVVPQVAAWMILWTAVRNQHRHMPPLQSQRRLRRGGIDVFQVWRSHGRHLARESQLMETAATLVPPPSPKRHYMCEHSTLRLRHALAISMARAELSTSGPSTWWYENDTRSSLLKPPLVFSCSAVM
jgi:hypothetical protein